MKLLAYFVLVVVLAIVTGGDAAKSDRPVKPIRPQKPIGPNKPTRPLKPVRPIKPFRPYNPERPVKPFRPYRPERPVNLAGGYTWTWTLEHGLQGSIEKRGRCPAYSFSVCRYSQNCILDRNCYGNMKCCNDACGKICKLPVFY